MNESDRSEDQPNHWPPWFEPRLPTAAECSPGLLLAQRAGSEPDRTFVAMDDGRVWSNREAFATCRDTAAKLAGKGLVAGEPLLLWLPNGPDLLRYLFATWMLGVVPVPLNIALRGSPLANALRTIRARMMIAHPALIGRLEEIDPESMATLQTVVLLGTGAVPHSRLDVVPEHDLTSDPVADDIQLNQPWDIAAIIFSSGTTGPAKGVQTPFAQLWSLGRAFYGHLRRDDRMLLILPLFHVAALGALFGSLTCGATLALTESFRAAQFLRVVRSTSSTTVPGLGRTLISTLNKTPPQPDDWDNPLRVVLVQSVNPEVRQFAERFRCDVIASYSMTETSCISISEINPRKDGSIGRPRSGLEVRLVDEHDVEVPVGSPGEVVVRAELPWVLNAGYLGNAEATARAWRNGWFHTGDLARRDADGDLFFLDRAKDVIRRRSENISSVELEAEILQHPDVQDAAAIGVETPEGEEVLVVVAPVAGRTIDPEQLLRFLIPRLPHFMLPRFIRTVPELPKTQTTNRVQKAELRKVGLTADCWDREAAGIHIKRERLQ